MEIAIEKSKAAMLFGSTRIGNCTQMELRYATENILGKRVHSEAELCGGGAERKRIAAERTKQPAEAQTPKQKKPKKTQVQ
jgi:hypothetical protein